MCEVELVYVMERRRTEATEQVEAKMASAQIKASSISVNGVCCWEVLLHVSMCVRVRAMTLRP